MVQTRRSTSFAQAWPLFSALAKQNGGRVAALCAQQPSLAAAYAPGDLSPLHFCVLVADAASIPVLAAAGTPLEVKLTLHFKNTELSKWLDTARQEAPTWLRSWRDASWCRGATPLSLALQLSQEGTAKALIDAGADVWPHVSPYAQNIGVGQPYNNNVYLPAYIRTWLLPYLVQRFVEGRLPLSNEQLGVLVRLALAAGQQGMGERVLSAAAGRPQPRLAPADGPRLLTRAVELGAVGLLKLLLQLGAPPVAIELTTHRPMVEFAADKGQCESMTALLEAGAPLSPRLLTTVVRKLHPRLLRTLLDHGPISVDTSRIYLGGHWTCPVLNLLAVKPNYAQLPLVLQMAEMLADAGYRPTVYPGYNPLQMQPERTFELNFSNRYTLLPFQAEGWSLAVHHKYPPGLQAAFRAVLLCAARSTRRHAEMEAKRPGVAGPALLGALPQELLLRILHLAARPVSAWVLR